MFRKRGRALLGAGVLQILEQIGDAGFGRRPGQQGLAKRPKGLHPPPREIAAVGLQLLDQGQGLRELLVGEAEALLQIADEVRVHQPEGLVAQLGDVGGGIGRSVSPGALLFLVRGRLLLAGAAGVSEVRTSAPAPA